MKLFYTAILLTGSLLLASSPAHAAERIAPVDTEISAATPTPVDLTSLPTIEDVNLLFISDELKYALDRSLGHIKRKQELPFALYDLLYSQNHLNIRYEDHATHTALETFQRRHGNCLSMASLYVAAARHLGLDARFQSVDIPLDWASADNLYVISSHVNVGIVTRGGKLTVELTDDYSPEQTRTLKTARLSDDQALADYYNNLGMEHFQQGELPMALAYLLKATGIDRKSSHNWSNLGVLYKRAGYPDQALQAYTRALRLNSDNTSALTNLYVLYHEQGLTDKADKMLDRVTRNSRKNPYVLSHLAESSMALKQYREAIQLLRRAIKVKKDEPLFYFNLSLAYYHVNNLPKSLSAMNTAQQLAQTDPQSTRYQQKADALMRLQTRL